MSKVITATFEWSPGGDIRISFSDMAGLTVGRTGDSSLNAKTANLFRLIKDVLGVRDVYTQVDGAIARKCIVVVCLNRGDEVTAIAIGKDLLPIVEAVIAGVKVNDKEVFWLVKSARTRPVARRRF